MSAAKKPGNKKIRTGKKDLEKGILGSRGYNLLTGAKDIYQGEKAKRRGKRK